MAPVSSPERLLKWIPLFQVLATLNPARRVILLAHLNDETRDQIYQVVNHVLSGGPSMTVRKRRFLRSRLGPYKRHFRDLTNPRASKRRRKKAMYQVGGAPMTTVLRTAVPILFHIYSRGRF